MDEIVLEKNKRFKVDNDRYFEEEKAVVCEKYTRHIWVEKPFPEWLKDAFIYSDKFSK